MILAGTAVAALILAIVFSSTMLYVIAALLAVVFVVLQFAGDSVSGLISRLMGSSSEMAISPVGRAEEDLSDLGIIEIRPKKSVNPVRGSGKGILEQEPVLIDQIKKPTAARPATISTTSSDEIPRSKPIRTDNYIAPDSPAGDGRNETVEVEPFSNLGRAENARGSREDGAGRSQYTDTEPDGFVQDRVGTDVGEKPVFGDEMVSAARPVSKKKPAADSNTSDSSGTGASSDEGQNVTRYAVSFAGESLDVQSVVPLLESAVAALGSTTAVIVTRIAESSRYRIVGIVSSHKRARRGGQFTADAPYLPRRRKKDDVVHLEAPDSLEPSHIRYYDGDVDVAHQAIIPVAATTGDYLFIADFADTADDFERIDPIMVGYAAALRALLSSSTILSNAALAKTSVVVSRALAQARAARTPLAMALVCMKDGERFLSSERDVVLAAERELEALLDSLTPDGKIEKLADLTFGVFLTDEVNHVEQWALKLQDAVDERATSPDVTSSIVGSVIIGVAMLSDRHETADDLREDALAALEESFQSGACTILE